MKNKNDIQAQLNSLRAEYMRDYPSRIKKLKAAWQSCIAHGISHESLSVVHRLAHNIKGSGSTFGYPQVSALGDALYSLISDALQSDEIMNTALQGEVGTLIEKLENIELNTPAAVGECVRITTELPQTSEYRTGQRNTENYVLLVEDNELLARDIGLQLARYGYTIKTLHDTENLDSCLKENLPNAIIMDAALPGFEAIRQLKQTILHLPPILFLSDHTEMESRIMAARAGGSAYLTKPINLADLVSQLDKLTHKKIEKPHRILVVDDTRSLAQFYCMTLENAGMVCRMVTEPMKVIEEASAFGPDLILMDMYMPGCNGTELARVIRQLETYVSTPIVFLSSEKDTNKQLQAISEGGDDFLTKPIEPEHLVAAVKARAVRYHKLRSLMTGDSLTGLYNHTKTRDLLETEISRANRSNGIMILAMLDIDRFEFVNDSFGHLTGDHVIKSLASLLKQRLRRTDVVGRYGSEEFAIILPDTTLENAEKLMNEIRENFACIVHKTDNTEFTATVSCGIASFPQYTDAVSLDEAASSALFLAKEKGSNQVRIAR